MTNKEYERLKFMETVPEDERIYLVTDCFVPTGDRYGRCAEHGVDIAFAYGCGCTPDPVNPWFTDFNNPELEYLLERFEVADCTSEKAKKFADFAREFSQHLALQWLSESDAAVDK